VLPFLNRSDREEDDVFADCMVEDLTAALSVIRWMKVVAASATAAYRTGARNLREIGREIGVRYLLEGNLRRVLGDLRITAQLVEAENGNILWTQRYDRPIVELSAMQEDLVAEVAAHLSVQVHRVEMEHALEKPRDLSAWEASLRSNAYASRRTRPGFEAAVAEARRAVEIDPDDGAVRAILAAAQGRLFIHLGGDDPELEKEILENVRRARPLDPNNPVVLLCAASALDSVRRQQDALALAERAVAISPNLGPRVLPLQQSSRGSADRRRRSPNWRRPSVLGSTAFGRTRCRSGARSRICRPGGSARRLTRPIAPFAFCHVPTR
jgi:TolB-like protein